MTDEAFDAILIRARPVDATGCFAREELADPDAWRLADELREVGMPLHVTPVGRCRLAVISADDSDLARMCLLEDQVEGNVFVRAIVTIGPGVSPPACGDLLLVLVDAGTALAYEVVLAAGDLQAPEPGAIALVTLPAGQAVLQLRADLGLLDLAAQAASNQSPGSPRAQH